MNDTSQTTIADELIGNVCTTLSRDKQVRRKLPDWGQIRIDRLLPFLCVYRRPAKREDAGTERLLLGEAAYVLATGSHRLHSSLSKLIIEIMRLQQDVFGTSLILELWSDDEVNAGDQAPGFRIISSRHNAPTLLLDKIQNALLGIRINNQTAEVALEYQDYWAPPGLKPLLKKTAWEKLNCIHLGLAVRPVYRDADNGELFPFELNALHHGLARALKRIFYEFAHSYTAHRPRHYHELGQHVITKAVKETDRQLAEISNSFDLLLHVTPVNKYAAWAKFKRDRFQNEVEFLYRPCTIDPALMKRRLFQIPIERIEDPTLTQIYTEKREELDRQITLLADRNSKRFLLGSRQLFGDIDDALLALARSLVEELPAHSRDDRTSHFLNAEQFSEHARKEIEYYRQQSPDFKARVEVRSDIAGILVSKGNLLIAKDAHFPIARLDATLAHEIGTHVLTYYNGQQQPLHELYTGMASYEATQEGLAVLSEYLVGGLSRPRLRTLAGRVLAVDMVTNGAGFIETFRQLHQQYEFNQENAFDITMRVFRGGGYTKDAVYLRGLSQLQQHLASGKELTPLYFGKVALEHLPLIEELQWRKVLQSPSLMPRFLQHSVVNERLARLGKGISVMDIAREVDGCA